MSRDIINIDLLDFLMKLEEIFWSKIKMEIKSWVPLIAAGDSKGEWKITGDIPIWSAIKNTLNCD